MISLKAIPTFFDISILELLAAVFWSFITLSTYYSPAVIGNVWMKAIGPLKHGLPKPAEAATAHLPIILFESIVAKWFLQVFEVSSALEGGCVAVLLYLFLGLPSLAGGLCWDGRSSSLLYIDGLGNCLVAFVRGVVLGYMVRGVFF